MRSPMQHLRAIYRSAEVLARLKAAGLGSIQGTAAEILVDSVRQVICPTETGYG